MNTPEEFPPHPPLVSGGWYRGLVRGEVVGPGRYPVGDRSVGAAIGWGLIAVGVTVLAVVLVGFGALLVISPMAVVAAGIGARLRQ